MLPKIAWRHQHHSIQFEIWLCKNVKKSRVDWCVYKDRSLNHKEEYLKEKVKRSLINKSEQGFISIAKHSNLSLVLPAFNKSAAFDNFSVEYILSFLQNFGWVEREKRQIGSLNKIHLWNGHNEVNIRVCLNLFATFLDGLSFLGSFFFLLQKDLIVGLALRFLSVLSF